MDDEFAHGAMDNFRAFILGRNMFGPVPRGQWVMRAGGVAETPAPTQELFTQPVKINAHVTVMYGLR